MRVLALAALLLVAAAPAPAPDANAMLPADNVASVASDGPFLAADQPDPAADDPEVRRLSVELDRANLTALIGQAHLAAATNDYQATMYRHHQFWTDVAAVAVYIITFFGLICAGVQFHLFDRLRGIRVADEVVSAGVVELPGGAKVSSPFLGVIILFLSLGFFYLYLTNVYPILSVAELEAKRAVAGAKSPAK